MLYRELKLIFMKFRLISSDAYTNVHVVMLCRKFKLILIKFGFILNFKVAQNEL